jgi:hypothetical protein
VENAPSMTCVQSLNLNLPVAAQQFSRRWQTYDMICNEIPNPFRVCHAAKSES